MRTIRRVVVTLPVVALLATSLISVVGTTGASAAPAQTVDDAGAATLAVRQITRGAGGGPFHFELSDGATPASVHSGVATTAGDGDAVDVSGLVGTLAPGTYTLRQDLTELPADPTGGHWGFNGVECAGAPVTVDAPNGTATITLEAGAAATCVVTDTWVATTDTSAAEVAPTPTTNPPTTTAPDPPTTAAPTPTADDGDAIAATIEDAAPNGGDGNRDGLVDSRQSNVASLPAAVDVNGNGALDDYVTIVAPKGTTLTNVRALNVPSDNPPPDGVRLPYGLFDYDVVVARPGATANVTYVLPDDGVAPTSVHVLQNGVWTDYADHTSVDAIDRKVTVTLRDGGAGDETGTTDGVIEDPSGPSTSNQTITVTNASGASAPTFTFRLERCSETTGTTCTGATAVGTANGSNNASGDSAALANGASWFWGSPTTLEFDRNYRLSVITSLPASGWSLTGRNCSPDGIATTNDGATAIVMRLNNSTGNQRATCTFTFSSGTITVHKGGTRANPAGTDNGTNYANGLQGAVFESSPHNANTWSDLCTTDANGNCTSAAKSPGTYDVREKSAPAGWSTVSQLVFGGSSTGAGDQTHPYVGTATVGATGSANVSVQRTNNASDQDANHRFINVRDNHALPTACGITIALVLDRSGSITANRQAYIDAVNGTATQPGLLGSLAGTPTTIKIYSFAADATGPSANFDLSTTQGLADARAAVTTVYNSTGGGTNWDAGLSLAAGSGAPVTIFLTDGNPTTWNGSPNGNNSTITLNDLTAGVASANTVKGTSTIFAVGAGTGVTASNLALVSGPGDFFVSDIADLDNALHALANQFCGSRIHVRKLVGGQPQTGWSFTAGGGGAGVTFGNNPVVTAGAGGEGIIGVDNVPETGTAAPVTVTESLAGHPGFSLAAAACQLNSFPAANTGTPTNPQSIAQIQRNQDWFCTFNNVFSQSSSSTATVIHNAAHATVTSVPAGTIVHDQATVTGQTGLPVPTGTVTFSWFTNGTCTAPAAATSIAFTLNASGIADGTTFTQTPGVSGQFAFRATYSGDNIYTGSTGPCEPLTVTPITSNTVTVIHNATHATVTTVPAGTTVHDQATVSGALATPTGTVTFSWFTNGTCTTPAAATSNPFTLSGGVVDGTTFTQTPNVSGAFAFRATYSGDGTYTGSTGACEPLTVTPVASSTATVIHNAAHATVTSVPAGTVVHDQATVTGQAGLPVPTGTVTFSWFTNGTCTAPAAATSNAFTLNASGIADGTTFTQTPNVSGTFAFQATYSGNGTYNGSTGPCEPLTVTTVTSSTATVIHNAAHATVTTVPAGTTVHDQATVTGALGTPTGTVTFSWFTNGTCTAPAAATSNPFTLSGGTVDGTTFAQTPNLAGPFAFQATYSGDGTYTGSTGPCELLSVTPITSNTVTVIHNAAHATVTTVPAGTTVHDQATVSGALSTPTGTVTFSWFTNGTCTAPAAATSNPFTLSGGVVDATTFTQTPNVSGAFAFQATYSGDSTYTGSTGACEPLTVTPVASSTATVIHNAAHATVTSVPAGAVVHDQATVTGQAGLPVPTGTVTFSWFTNGTCTAPAAATSSAFTLAGGVVDATTFTQTPNVSGTFAFRATYSGNGTYTGSTGPCEPLTVTTVASSTATVIHNAAHATVTSVAAGTVVHDQATVTGQAGLPVPTGTVTFSWFTNGTCTAPAAATSSAFALSGGVVDGTTFTQTPNVSGTFAFQATYSGDNTYTGSTGACEPLTVTTVSSSTATVIHNAAHAPVTSVPAGTTVHDQATVTGQAGLPVPTGTVTFSWFTNGTCSAPPAATSSAFTLSGGAVDGTTFTQTPNVAGTFAFRATYSGDNTYTGSTGPCEPLEVTTLVSNTETVIHDAAHHGVGSVPAGTTVHDEAMVTGALGTPTGTVTFSWFTNGGCTGQPAATSDPFTLDVSGVVDGTTFTQTPNVAGSFSFQATYSGDGTYAGSTAACEPLEVTAVASSTATVIHNAAHATVTTVAAGTVVHDQATVTGQAGLPVPTGTVTFSWFTNGTCSAPPAATSSAFTLSGGAVDGTTFTQTPNVAGTFAFRATYSGDNTYTGSTGPCEPLTVTPITSNTVTVIHDATHATVTTVPAGTTVHDQATVNGALATPTGTVTFSWFTNGTCTAPAAAMSSAFTLDTAGIADATAFAFTPNVSGTFAFQATYSGDGTYTSSTGACEPLTVQSAAISVGKTSSVTQIVPGAPVPYTLTVTNSGPVTAVAVVVSDVLPAGLTFVSSDNPGCSSGDGVTVTCALGDLAAGGTVTVNVVTQAADPFPADAIDPTGNVPNTATVTSPNTNCPPDGSGGPECTSTVPLPVQPQLSIVKTSTVTQIVPGQTVPYTLTVTNTAPVVAPTVVVSDVLPAGLTFVSSDNPGCSSGDGVTVTCALGDLAAGGTVTVNVVTQAADPFPADAIDPTGNVPNTATVTSPNTNCPPDGSGGPECTSTVPLPVQPQLSIVKTSTVTQIVPGQTVPYTLTVSNTGPVDATNVVVTDPLPTGLTFDSSPDGCTADATLAVVTCTAATLAAGDDIAFGIVTQAANPFPSGSVNADGTVVNTATVTAPGTNCPEGSIDADCTSVHPLPIISLLTLVKEVINDDGGTAGPTDWTLTADGPTPIAGVTGTPSITDAPVSPGLYTVSETDVPGYVATAFTCDGGTQLDNTIMLAPGESATCTITNDDLQAEISIEKTSSATAITPGATVPYTFAVTNLSATPAQDVIVQDQLPVGLSFVSSPDGCTADAAQLVTCDIGALAPGATATRNIVTQAANPFSPGSVDPDGLVPNTATVTATDTNCPPAGRAVPTTGALGAQQATADGCASTDALPILPTLMITKTSAATDIAAGAQVPYTITVTNTGPVVAPGVVVTDTLPAGLSYVSSVPACTATGQVVTCPLGDLAAGASATIDLVTLAQGPLPVVGGQVVNVAVVVGASSNCGEGSSDPACRAEVSLPVASVAGEVVEPGNGSGGSGSGGSGLPFTGSSTLPPLIAAACLFVRFALLGAVRRRRRPHSLNPDAPS